ncbi:MAG: DUF58 domain-containing protein, partial [Dokdonella sp.]
MRPTLVLVASLLACALLGALAAFAWLPLQLFVAACAVFVLIAALDALRLRALSTPAVTRELPPIVAVGIERPVSLRLQHLGSHSL